MHLLLVRHGESEHNVMKIFAGSIDSPLSQAGVQQAVLLGKHLAATGTRPSVSHIFSSDLTRAARTARLIREACAPGVPVGEHRDLRERNLGTLEDRPYGVLSAWGDDTLTVVAAIRQGLVTGAETDDDMLVRVRRFIEGPLAEAWQDGTNAGTVVVASHGVLLKILFNALRERFGEMVAAAADGGGAVRQGFVGTPTWGNTAYVEAVIEGPSVPASASAVLVGGLATPADESVPVIEEGNEVDWTRPGKSPVFGRARIVIGRINCDDHLVGTAAAVQR